MPAYCKNSGGDKYKPKGSKQPQEEEGEHPEINPNYVYTMYMHMYMYLILVQELLRHGVWGINNHLSNVL